MTCLYLRHHMYALHTARSQGHEFLACIAYFKKIEDFITTAKSKSIPNIWKDWDALLLALLKSMLKDGVVTTKTLRSGYLNGMHQTAGLHFHVHVTHF